MHHYTPNSMKYLISKTPPLHLIFLSDTEMTMIVLVNFLDEWIFQFCCKSQLAFYN